QRRVVAEEGVDADETVEDPGMVADRLGDGVVGAPQVVGGRLHPAHEGALDARLAETNKEPLGGHLVAEDRLAEESEAVDRHRTASSSASTFWENTSRSSPGSSAASLTFSTSMRGEHAGPSLA